MRPRHYRQASRFLGAALLGPAGLLAQGAVNPSLVAVTPECSERPFAVPGEPAAIVAAAKRAVVHVRIEVDNGKTRFPIERPSCGVVVGEGLVLTWLELVREAEGATDKRVLVTFSDAEKTELVAKLAASDAGAGLALLAIEGQVPRGTPVLELADTKALAPGTPAVVLSRPDAKDLVAYAGVAHKALGATTLGGREVAAADLVLTDAMIEARCHGGALLDDAGRLLGLCNAEHVRRDVQEPTLQDLQAPSFGVALAAHALVAAFPDRLHVTPPREARPALAANPVSAAALVLPSVVSVWAGEGPLPKLALLDPGATQRRPGLGSGVVVSSSGLVLTNAHLLLGKAKVTVTIPDGRAFAAVTKAKHAATNMALLRVEVPKGTSLVPALCGDGKDAILAETVLAVGNPLGASPAVTIGVLSAKRANERLLQADPNLGNQNAGGALIDLTGRLIGIVDGGVVDKIAAAYARQGDQAKTETNLSTCVDLHTIRQHFGKYFEEDADAKESIRVPPPVDQGQRTARTTLRARVVEATGPALLNVYVSRSSRKAEDDANPFAAHQEVQIAGESLGSGVILDRQGLAVTNWHVVDAATEPDGSMKQDHVVHVRLWDGTTCEAKVLSLSREDDLALLQLTHPGGKDFLAVELGDSAALQIGEGVLAIGNPLGFANTITAGIVTAKEQGIHVKGRWAKFENLVETDAAINGGNSGGALLDLGGRLVGINSAGSHGFSSHGYAIPVDHVRKVVTELLLSPEKLRCPTLGFSVADVEGGVRVRAVDPRGPAARAGVAAGDRLVSVDGQRITWSVGLARTLLKLRETEACKLVLERAGAPLETAVTPLSAAAWAVLRQCGIEATAVDYAEAPELVRDASIALHRRFTGDAKAEPTNLLPAVVRVVRSTAEGVKPGDLLLGAEFQEQGATAEATTLRRFTSVADLQRCFNDAATGSYEGRSFACWIQRTGAIVVVPVVAKRLLP